MPPTIWSAKPFTFPTAKATLPLDLEELAAFPGNTGPAEKRAGSPPATRVGHIHLTVTNLDVSQKFYESLGLSLTANWGAFRFFSYNGYHHHLAISLASGHNAAPASRNVSGLAGFSLLHPSVSRDLRDPSHILLTPDSGGE